MPPLFLYEENKMKKNCSNCCNFEERKDEVKDWCREKEQYINRNGICNAYNLPIEKLYIGNYRVCYDVWLAHNRVINKMWLLSFFVVLLAFVIIVYGTYKTINAQEKLTYKKGYIEACKDFYEGKLKAEIVNLPNDERKWKMISNEK